MISIFDSITLSYTKLRTRKIRTAFTVLISGLLFGILCAALLISAGILTSIERFGQEGVGDKYIVSVTDSSEYISNDRYDALDDASVISKVKQLHDARVAAKKAEAKTLGIEYEASSEDPLPVTKDPATKQETIPFELVESPLVTQALDELLPAKKKTDLLQTAQKYDLKKQAVEYVIQPKDGQFMPMKNNQETTITEYGKPGGSQQNFEQSYESMLSSYQSMSIEDDVLAKPYVTRSFDPKSATKVPLIVPFAYAENALGLKKLASGASSGERLERIKEVRNRIGEIQLSFCYRNGTSQNLLNQALETRAEIAKNKSNKDYKQPSLIYGVPETTSCATPQIISDTRTKDERSYSDKKAIFDKKFNGETDPISVKLEFQIVGLSPSIASLGSNQSLVDGITMMLAAGAVPHWQIPATMFTQLPASLKPTAIFGDAAAANTPSKIPTTDGTAVFEFNSLEGAKDYLAANSCVSCGIYASPYASTALLVENIKDVLRNIVYWASLVISVIAIILLASMVGRTIADGRRETAVFRAIGAKRIDIFSIYTWYTLLLALRTIIFVFLLGLGLAIAADYWLSNGITTEALVIFASQDLSLKFSLLSFNSPYLIYLPLLIIGISLISMVIPMLASIRRNPIEDMRQE